MAHSYWIILAFIPAVIVFLILTAYNRWVLGIKLPIKQRALKDYRRAEIVYAFFAALTIISDFLAGLYLLDRFEPVSAHLCYIFLLFLSLPFIGGMLGHYAGVRYQKGVGVQAMIYSLFLFLALIPLSGLAYNGFADEMPSRAIEVMVIEKRIQVNKGGGSPLVKILGIGDAQTLLRFPREKKIPKALYKSIRVGDVMHLHIKPGALGISWMKIPTR